MALQTAVKSSSPDGVGERWLTMEVVVIDGGGSVC